MTYKFFSEPFLSVRSLQGSYALRVSQLGLCGLARLRGLLLAGLHGQMMPYRASRHGTENSVMVGVVACDGSDDGTLDASCLCGCHNGKGQHAGRHNSEEAFVHPTLPLDPV